jgi:hypothetical protein
MSAGQKRARVEDVAADFAVISSMGSIRPVEIIPDSVAMFWLRKHIFWILNNICDIHAFSASFIC